jgi:hypothetical protein
MAILPNNLEDLLQMTEDKILRDIADFEAILERLPAEPTDRHEWVMRYTYVALLATRRTMLERLQAEKSKAAAAAARVAEPEPRLQ